MSRDNNPIRIIWSILLAALVLALLASSVWLFIQAMKELKEAIRPITFVLIEPLLVLLVEIAAFVFVALFLLFRSPWLLLLFLIVVAVLIFWIPPEEIPTFLINMAELLKSLATIALSLIAFALFCWLVIGLIGRHPRFFLALLGILLVGAIAGMTLQMN